MKIHFFIKPAIPLIILLGLTGFSANNPHKNRDQAEPISFWLCGEDPVVQAEKHKNQPADYMDLFKPDAAWSNAAARLTVFKISTQFALHSTDEQLLTVLNDLRRRHIALAIESGLLTASDHCGTGVEGYGPAGRAEAMVRRIKKFGGQIDYIAMDEPAWFGHYQKEGHGGVRCQDSIPELIQQLSPRFEVIRRYFPNVQIGDIEPITAKSPEFGNQIIQFADMIQAKLNLKLAFVHADIAFDLDNWQPLLVNLARQLHARGIRFGVIFKSGTIPKTNEEWIGQALQRCKEIVANPKIRPDDIIVQSWQPLPTKMLPETDPGALTYELEQVMALVH